MAQTGHRITASTDADALPDAPPLLMPLASPKIDDLLLPVLLSNVNLGWDVWLQDARSGRFTPAGQLSGIDVARDRSGAIVTLGRSSCCEWTHSVWRIGADRQLVRAFEIDAPPQESGRISDCTPNSLRRKAVSVATRPDPGRAALP